MKRGVVIVAGCVLLLAAAGCGSSSSSSSGGTTTEESGGGGGQKTIAGVQGNDHGTKAVEDRARPRSSWTTSTSSRPCSRASRARKSRSS